MADAYAKCTHLFLFIRQDVHSKGVTARCPRCRGTFTAWPGTMHYDEIIAARDRDVREEYVIAYVALERIVDAESRGQMKSLAANALETLRARKATASAPSRSPQTPPPRTAVQALSADPSSIR